MGWREWDGPQWPLPWGIGSQFPLSLELEPSPTLCDRPLADGCPCPLLYSLDLYFLLSAHPAARGILGKNKSDHITLFLVSSHGFSGL